MSSGRYTAGMSRNQKRKVRLHDRLAIAAADADSRAAKHTAMEGPASQGSGSGQAKAGPSAPSKPLLLDQVDQVTISDSDDDEADGISTPKKGAGRGSGSGKVPRAAGRGSGSEPKAELRAAKDVRRGTKREAEQPVPKTVRWLELPATQRARVKTEGGRVRGQDEQHAAAAEQAHGVAERPPWRSGGSSENEARLLRGCRKIIPRWQVEASIGTPKEERPLDAVLLSKIATQLLRWGRSDLRMADGSKATVTIPNWSPTGWIPLSEVAALLEVSEDFLAESLPSCGRHGPRVLIENGFAKAA